MVQDLHWLVKNFLQRLVDTGLLTAEAAASALAVPTAVVAYLVQNNLIPAKTLAARLAEYLRLSLFDLHEFDLTKLPAQFLDERLVKTYNVIPLYLQNDCLHLGIVEPAQLASIKEIKLQLNQQVQAAIVAYDKFKLIANQILTQQQYQIFKRLPAEMNATHDEAVVKFVQQILADAIHKNASDIHCEPYKDVYRIRLRIDGILHELMQIPVDLAGRVTARLKVIAQLDITERRLPQDGRFSFSEHTQAYDCRISTCPTLFGEKIVIRILYSDKLFLTIDELGLEAEQKQSFLQHIKLPQGLILVTGPTGSGKSASLYAALSLLNTVDKNILTVEEPVEIQLQGINQVNVNSKIGLNFAVALRAFLRQDPDVIMLGEVRDAETAEIAIKAAQTGHLVLATLHTNSAVETLTRLQNMGIAPFNIADSVKLIIAQRLLRKLCSYCKQMQDIGEELLSGLGLADDANSQTQLYTATGCEHCIKGYKGRIGVFELLVCNKEMAKVIARNSNANAVAEYMQQQGQMNLYQAAMQKVRQGITSLEELQRVVLLPG